MFDTSIPIVKSKEQIDFYQKHGPKFLKVLKKLAQDLRSFGVSTAKDLQRNFLSYVHKSFPSSILHSHRYPFADVVNQHGIAFEFPLCISVNDVIAHGTGDYGNYSFKINDIVSVDVGLKLGELCFDAAFTVTYGNAEDEQWVLEPLMQLERIEGLYRGCKDYHADWELTTYTLAEQIQHSALSMRPYDGKWENRLAVVTTVCGHGIGKALHEPPYIFNMLPDSPAYKYPLIDNLVFCAEPVYVYYKDGNAQNVEQVYIDSDGWSIRTVSGNPGTHFETMFAVIKGKVVDLLGMTSNWCEGE